MKNIIMFFLFLSVLLHANYKTLSNGDITFSVSDSGAIGTGLPKIKGKGIYANGIDYLNEDVGIPFEFFSLLIDESEIYANDNAQGDDSSCLRNDRLNHKNITTRLKKINNTITTTTTLENKFQISHKYSMDKKEIIVQVEVKNLTNDSHNFQYTRGIDMDPPSDGYYTTQSRGYKDKIPKRDLIYTIAKGNKFPLSLFVNNKKNKTIYYHSHITSFKNNHCVYNPKNIIDDVVEGKYIDAVIFMVFELGNIKPGETKSFSFSYALAKDLDNLAKRFIEKYYPKKSKVKNHNPIKPIVYKYTPTFEPIDNSSFTIDAESGEHIKKDERTHNYKLHAKNIPKGIQIHFGDKILSASNKSITIPFEYGKKIEYSVHRNKDFKEANAQTIKLTLDKNGEAENNKIEIVIKPQLRKISFKISENHRIEDDGSKVFDINLSKLETSKPIPINILVVEQEITIEEYRKFKIDVTKVDGIGWNDAIGDNGETAIQLELDSLTDLGLIPMYCLTETGKKLPVTVTVEKGVYPGDIAEETLYVRVNDDMTLWEECQMLVYVILIILFLLWYLFGLYTKDRFCRVQTIDKYKVDEDGDKIRIFPPIKFKKKVSWWQELIPYKREWIYFDGMKFMAGTNCSSVYLSKKTQAGLLVDGFFDNPEKNDKQIQSNIMISRGNEEFNIK